MSELQHTPTPWRAIGPSGAPLHDPGDYAIVDADEAIIAEAFLQVAKDTMHPAAANAAFIVKAVNSHDDLLEALKEVTHWADSVIGEPDKAMGVQEYGNKVIKAAVAAIKRAEEATIKHSPSNPCRCKGPSWKPHDADCALWKVEAPA